MASGMGMPSIGIYSYELYKFYDVENIIRIGSAGAYTDKLKVLDVVLADAVWSESTYGHAQSLDMKNWQYPSEELNRQIKDTALKMNKKLVCGDGRAGPGSGYCSLNKMSASGFGRRS